MLSKIRSITDVKWVAKLLVDEGIIFYPEDDITKFVNDKTSEPAYALKEAELKNSLTQQCFVVCEKEEHNTYAVIHPIFLVETNWNKHIPFPA